VDVTLANGISGRAIAPAGASRGKREAVDLRDGGDRLRGKDVTQALANVNGPIAQALIGLEVVEQSNVDKALVNLDSSALKETLGGNAIVASSLAVLHAAAADADKPLWRHVADHYEQVPSIPLPEIQIFGGGAHAGRQVDIQDFMIMVPGAASFDEVMEITSEIYFAAGDLMSARGHAAGIADEGGWWPAFNSNEQALETLVKAIEMTGEKPGERVVISLDIAASEFGEIGAYNLALENRTLTSEAFVDLLGEWIAAYPIASIEDPVAEDDTDAMQEFTQRFGKRIQVIGDDYLVTQAELVSRAIGEQACNAVLIKVNQVGTVTEAINTLQTARDAGWGTVVSARSGETEDVSISHLATGLGSGQLKVGSFQRSERMVKWNECLRIQEALGSGAFVGGGPMMSTWWGDQPR
jgi:enolase